MAIWISTGAASASQLSLAKCSSSLRCQLMDKHCRAPPQFRAKRKGAASNAAGEEVAEIPRHPGIAGDRTNTPPATPWKKFPSQPQPNPVGGGSRTDKKSWLVGLGARSKLYAWNARHLHHRPSRMGITLLNQALIGWELHHLRHHNAHRLIHSRGVHVRQRVPKRCALMGHVAHA